PDSTQAHPRDTKIGSDMAELYSLDQARMIFQKFPVAFRSRADLPGNKPFLCFYQFLLRESSPPVGDMYIPLEKRPQVGDPKFVQVTVFQKLYVFIAFLIFDITSHRDDDVAF